MSKQAGSWTVRNILSPLTEALDAARKRDLVRRNVAEDVELPSRKQPNLHKLTPEEIQRFLDLHPSHFPACVLATACL